MYSTLTTVYTDGGAHLKLSGVKSMNSTQLETDYLVVGRPIRTANDPAIAAEAIQKDIARALENP